MDEVFQPVLGVAWRRRKKDMAEMRVIRGVVSDRSRFDGRDSEYF